MHLSKNILTGNIISKIEKFEMAVNHIKTQKNRLTKNP